MKKNNTQQELVAIYNVADVCLVTSLRDGMNLVRSIFCLGSILDQEIADGIQWMYC